MYRARIDREFPVVLPETEQINRYWWGRRRITTMANLPPRSTLVASTMSAAALR